MGTGYLLNTDVVDNISTSIQTEEFMLVGPHRGVLTSLTADMIFPYF